MFTLLAKTSHFAEAPQAQVSRVKVNLHSVGQGLTCLLSPLGTGKQSRHPTDAGQIKRKIHSKGDPRYYVCKSIYKLK